MKRFTFALLFLVAELSVAQSSMPSAADTVLTKSQQTFYVGDTAVEVLIHQKAGDNLTYFNMHDNENTSVDAGLSIVRQFGGRLIEFKHNGERNIRFNVAEGSFTFDPNRMFTDIGAEKSIKSLSNNRYSPAALQAVRGFATAVVDYLQLDSSKVVVALHNNTNENYNIRDYLPGGTYANDVAQTQYLKGSDADDFYYVTDIAFYAALADAGKNVTLQRNGEAADDGSFSIYCGLKGIPYINVEAEHGHFASQIVLLEVLRESLVQAD